MNLKEFIDTTDFAPSTVAIGVLYKPKSRAYHQAKKLGFTPTAEERQYMVNLINGYKSVKTKKTKKAKAA